MVLVFDICSRSSFESLAKWLLFVKQVSLCLLGEGVGVGGMCGCVTVCVWVCICVCVCMLCECLREAGFWSSAKYKYFMFIIIYTVSFVQVTTDVKGSDLIKSRGVNIVKIAIFQDMQ